MLLHFTSYEPCYSCFHSYNSLHCSTAISVFHISVFPLGIWNHLPPEYEGYWAGHNIVASEDEAVQYGLGSRICEVLVVKWRRPGERGL